MYKYVILILLFAFSVANSKTERFVPFTGEELLYEVSYMGVKLGTIKIVTGNHKKEGKNDIYKTYAYIDTYKEIPFVDIHVTYNSFTDYSFGFSHRFFGNFKSGNYTDVHKIFFNYEKNNIYVSKENADGKYFENSIMTEKKVSDGLSIFFIARKFLDIQKTLTIPTIIDKELVSTKINFKCKSENISIAAIKYPIKTLYFDGTAYWTGVYGLTGQFEGWFTDDAARIPIRANMKLSVGSVQIELKSWSRKGWVAPKA